MAYLFDGGTSKIALAAAVITAVPLTIACFFKPAATGTTYTFFAADNGLDTQRFTMTGSGTISMTTTGTTGASATTSESFVTNKWQTIAAVSGAVNSRFAVLNGRFSTENTTSKTPSGINAFLLGNHTVGTSSFAGLMAEFAVWQAALTPRELQSFTEGKPASLIRPESLKLYMPLTTQMGIADFGPQMLVFTNTACIPVADHPTILRPTGVKPWQ